MEKIFFSDFCSMLVILILNIQYLSIKPNNYVLFIKLYTFSWWLHKGVILLS